MSFITKVATFVKTRKIAVGSILAGALVIAGGVGVYAFLSSRVDPQATINQALVKSLQAKTAFTKTVLDVTTKGGMKVSVEVLAQSSTPLSRFDTKFHVQTGFIDVNLSGSGIYTEDGEIYFKIDNPAYLARLFAAGNQNVADLAERLQNTWVKISQQDLLNMNADAASINTCVRSFVRAKLQPSDVKPTEAILAAHPYMQFVRELPNETVHTLDSRHYEVRFTDSDAAALYGKLARLNSFQGVVADCKDAVEHLNTLTDDQLTADTNTTQDTWEVWVDKKSGNFSKIYSTSKSNDVTGTLSQQILFDRPLTATEPVANVMGITELIDALQNGYPTEYFYQ